MDILALERAFNAVNNAPIDRFVDVNKLNDEVEKFGERYRKKYIEGLEKRIGDANGKAADALKKSNNALDSAKNLGNEVKNRFKDVQRMAKGMERWASIVSGVLGVAGLVISLASLLQSEKNQAAFDKQIDRFQIDASRQLSIMQTLKFRIDKANADIKASNKQIDILKREANLASDAIKLARSWADRAYKLANDGLYESRTKLRRLNDIVAQANSNASKALVQNTTLKSSIASTDGKLRTTESKLNNQALEISSARSGIRLIDSKATTALTTAQQLPAKVPALAQPAINNAIAPLKPQIQQAQTTAQQAKAENPPQNQRIADLENRVRAIQNKPVTNAPSPNAPSPASLDVIRPLVNQAVNNSISGYGILPRLTATEVKADAALRQSSAALSKPEIEPIGRSALGLGANNSAAIDQLSREIQTLKAPNLLEPRITAVETKVRERERVDAQANAKLDYQTSQLEKLAIITGGLALMAPQIINTLSPQIQALPGATATAVAAAPCNGKGCGGRTAQRVDGIADEVQQLKQQVNQIPDAVGAYNATANTAQLGLLSKIDETTSGITQKLGNLLPNGGIAGYLQKMAESTHLDKVLLALNLYTNVHNAYQLSSGLTQTLFSATSNVLAVFGVKDLEGNPLDIGSILGKSFDETMQQAFGVTEWEGIKTEYKKYNRIYQSGANLLSSFQSIAYNIQESQNVIGSWIAQIGNGLKRDGGASEKAWRWCNERPDFKNPFFNAMERLENLEDVTSQIDQVAGNILSVQQTATEIVKQKDELDKAISELNPNKQAVKPAEAVAVSAEATRQKLTSQSPAIAVNDQQKPEV